MIKIAYVYLLFLEAIFYRLDFFFLDIFRFLFVFSTGLRNILVANFSSFPDFLFPSSQIFLIIWLLPCFDNFSLVICYTWPYQYTCFLIFLFLSILVFLSYCCVFDPVHPKNAGHRCQKSILIANNTFSLVYLTAILLTTKPYSIVRELFSIIRDSFRPSAWLKVFTTFHTFRRLYFNTSIFMLLSTSNLSTFNYPKSHFSYTSISFPVIYSRSSLSWITTIWSFAKSNVYNVKLLLINNSMFEHFLRQCVWKIYFK